MAFMFLTFVAPPCDKRLSGPPRNLRIPRQALLRIEGTALRPDAAVQAAFLKRHFFFAAGFFPPAAPDPQVTAYDSFSHFSQTVFGSGLSAVKRVVTQPTEPTW